MTADEFFARTLSGRWMLRQMRRLAPSRDLPKAIDFEFTWHPKQGVTRLALRADDSAPPTWLTEIFTHLFVLRPAAKQFQPVRVKGTLTVTDQAR